MSKIQKIANGKCREHVRNRKTFDGNNLYARMFCITDGAGSSNEFIYAVFSYGPHFPLFIYHYPTETWFENEDRYSVTTSKHRSQAHPLVPVKKASTKFLCNLIDRGLVEAVEMAA